MRAIDGTEGFSEKDGLIEDRGLKRGQRAVEGKRAVEGIDGRRGNMEPYRRYRAEERT